MAAVVNLLNGFVDSTVKKTLEQNQNYKDAKEDLEEDAANLSTVEKVSAVFAIVGIILVALGVGNCAGRNERVGGLMIGCGVPLAIFSYNCYQASENFIAQVEEDPAKLMILTKTNQPILIDKAAVRKCLLDKTLFFRPVVDRYMQHTVQCIVRDE